MAGYDRGQSEGSYPQGHPEAVAMGPTRRRSGTSGLENSVDYLADMMAAHCSGTFETLLKVVVNCQAGLGWKWLEAAVEGEALMIFGVSNTNQGQKMSRETSPGTCKASKFGFQVMERYKGG